MQRMEIDLFKTSQALEAIREGLEIIDTETGEVVFDSESVEALGLKLDELVCGLCDYIDTIEAERARIQSIVETAQKRLENIDAQRDAIEAGIADSMRRAGVSRSEWSGRVVQIKSRKSKQVKIVDSDKIPGEFLRETVKTSEDKEAIRKAIESGRYVPGAELVVNHHERLVRS